MSGRKNIEDAIQKQLVLWLQKEYPQIEFYFNKNEGLKNIIEAVNDKKMGLKAGYPDLVLFTPKKGVTYILHLELKKKKGKLNDAQRDWHSKFISTANRKAAIAYGYTEAQTAILNWLRDISENN